MYLPAFEGALPSSAPALKNTPASPSKRDICILLVDDQVTVREPLAEVLAELGYRVTQAGDGAQGLNILSSSQPVDFLISDVGLPGHLNGRQLADAARLLRPALKVLFITGYADIAASAGGLAGQGMEVMVKPFGLDEFEGKVLAMTQDLQDRPLDTVVA